MILKLLRTIYLTAEDAVLHHLARLAVSDRKWYIDADDPTYFYIPVRDSEKRAINLFIRSLMHSDNGCPQLVVFNVPEYAEFLHRSKFIVIDPEFTLPLSGNEMIPYINGYDMTSLKKCAGLDFSDVSFDYFMEMNNDLFLGRREYDPIEIALNVRSIIGGVDAYDSYGEMELEAEGWNISIDGKLYPHHIDLVPLIVAARRAIPILEVMNEREITAYPVPVLSTLLERYPKQIEKMGNADDNIYSLPTTFLLYLENRIAEISNMAITTAPSYLFEASLYYLQSIDKEFVDKVRASMYDREKRILTPIFVSDDDLVFESTKAAWILSQIKCDVNVIKSAILNVHADYQSVFKYLEIASNIDKSGFYLFIKNIQLAAKRSGYDIDFALHCFLMDSGKLDEEARGIALDIIKSVEDEPTEERKEEEMSEDKICENVRVGSDNDDPPITVSRRIEKTFTFINPDEVMSITFERGSLNDSEKCARSAGYCAFDPYGFTNLIVEDVHVFRRFYEGDFSGFENHGEAIATALEQIYVDLGEDITIYILHNTFKKIIVPNVSCADMTYILDELIYPNIKIPALTHLTNVIMKKSYRNTMHAFSPEAALVLFAAANAPYNKENVVQDWVQFALHNLYGASTKEAKNNLYYLVSYLSSMNRLEQFVKRAFSLDLRKSVFVDIFTRLVDENTDIPRARSGWWDLYQDAIEVAHKYLSTYEFNEVVDEELHDTLSKLPLNQKRLNELGILGTNYSTEQIIYLSAWSYDEMNVKFGPIINSLRSATKKMLVDAGESEDNITYEPTFAKERFDLMNETIGIVTILKHLELERDNDGVPFNCIENLLRAIAYHNLSREGVLSKEDAEYLDEIFCDVEIYEFNDIVRGIEMICAIS